LEPNWPGETPVVVEVLEGFVAPLEVRGVA